MVDLRVIRVGIEVSGQINWYTGLRIKANGTKMANPTENECTVTISGLSTDVRDYILTETSPFNSNRTPKRIIVEAGRVSTGTFRLFVGDIESAEPGPPPDVDLIIKAKTGSAQKGVIAAIDGQGLSRLQTIAQQVASRMDLSLNFQATDKNIGNFSFTGPQSQLVNKLQEAGGVRAFIDDAELIVKDAGKALSGKVRILNSNSGLVGLPKITEKGVQVTYLIDGESALGGLLRLDSKFNPAASGDYTIDQLKFDIATHEDPFYYVATCSRL